MPTLYKIRCKPVKAIQISPQTIHEITNLTAQVTDLHIAIESETHYLVVLTTPSGAHLIGQHGDYLFQDAVGNYHLYPQKTFERQYEPLHQCPTQPNEEIRIRDIMHHQTKDQLDASAPPPLDALALPV